MTNWWRYSPTDAGRSQERAELRECSLLQSSRLNVQGALGHFKLSKSKVGEVATILAAHAPMFCLPFRGPCKHICTYSRCSTRKPYSSFFLSSTLTVNICLNTARELLAELLRKLVSAHWIRGMNNIFKIGCEHWWCTVMLRGPSLPTFKKNYELAWKWCRSVQKERKRISTKFHRKIFTGFQDIRLLLLFTFWDLRCS